MNKEIMKAAGFGKAVEAVEIGKCPFCYRSVAINEFKDELSRREFAISGLCQACQDKMFS